MSISNKVKALSNARAFSYLCIDNYLHLIKKYIVMEKRLTEIEKEITFLLLNDFVQAKEMEVAQIVSDKIRVLESERNDIIKGLYENNKPDSESDSVHDFILEAADPLLDSNELPTGYQVECLTSYPSFLYRRCWETHVKVSPPNCTSYYLRVTTTRKVKGGTIFKQD